jgi:RecB family exonuclease
MPEATIAKLKSDWTDKSVTADASVPELARFRGRVGRVVTVNENGLAIVDFAEGPWYDIPVRHLQVVEKPGG